MTDKLGNIDRQSNQLSNIAERLEERDARSNWDWVTLGMAMLVAAGLAGAGAVYFTKQELNNANFQNTIRLIQKDDRAYWCGSAPAATFKSEAGDWYCAVAMPQYQEPEEPTAEGE